MMKTWERIEEAICCEHRDVSCTDSSRSPDSIEVGRGRPLVTFATQGRLIRRRRPGRAHRSAQKVMVEGRTRNVEPKSDVCYNLGSGPAKHALGS